MTTKAQAEKVFNRIQKHYRHNGWNDQPELIPNWNFVGYSNGEVIEYPKVDWAIVWEGGPDNWVNTAWTITQDLEDVYVEPYTSWAITIQEQ